MTASRTCTAAAHALVTLVVVLLLGTAAAQPFAADGGFGRPVAIAGPDIIATVAAAEHEGVIQAVWADTTGVWLRPLFDTDAEPVRVVEGRSFRAVSAATAGGDIAIAWLERDLRTGRTHHSLMWRSQTNLLFDANLEVPLLVGSAGGRPWVIAVPREGGEARITLYRVLESGALDEPVVLHSTPLGVTGVSAAGVDEELGGPAVVAWLEGRTTTSAFGPESEWSAHLLDTRLDARPLELGVADVLDQRQAVAVGVAADDRLHALWLTLDGHLELTDVTRTADALEVAGRSTIAEAGRPIGVSADAAFWTSGAFVRRALIGEADEQDAVTSVAWSPTIIEGAAIVLDEATAGDGSPVTLAWYGRLQGRGIMAYASDDSVPFTPGITDRIAARMGWSPWTAWQEALGQGLTALLAGVTVTLGLSPVLFLLTLLAVQVPSFRERPAVTGAVIGVLTPVVVVIVAAVRFPSPALASALSVGTWLSAIPFLLVGAALGLLATRRGDREPQLTAFLAACATVFIALTCLAFVHYHAWAAFVGLV